MMNSQTFSRQHATIFSVACDFVEFIDMTEYYTLAAMNQFMFFSREPSKTHKMRLWLKFYLESQLITI